MFACLALILLFSTTSPSSFVIILIGKSFITSEPGCFTLIVFLMSCDCKCSVALPHGAVGWSAVCDCGTS